MLLVTTTALYRGQVCWNVEVVVVSTEEKPKSVWEAERQKLEAEAQAAMAQAEKDRAEAEKLMAQARYEQANTKELELDLRKAQIVLEDIEYKRACELSKDEYHHVYIFKTGINGASVEDCMKQLRVWTRMDAEKPAAEKTPLEIWFYSPGGSVIDGMALFDYIQQVKAMGHHVTTGCMGYAASMAGILLQAGHRRVMGRESYVLIHEVAAGAAGKIGEIEDTVEFLKKIEDRVLDIFAERSKGSGCEKPLSKKQIANRWRRKDWWLTSEECIKHGFVDELR